jgi:hypothetical protein
VREAVGERIGDETAVASGRAGRHHAGLQDEDVAGGVGALGLDRRPQAGQAPADDDQIGLLAADERRRGLRCARTVGPEHRVGGVAQRALDEG